MIWNFNYGSPRERTIPVLLYHKITSEFGMGGVWNTPKQFRTQMECLKANGFRTLPIDEAFGDFKEKSVVITFDDGYEGVYTHAFPILKELNFTASIFVITEYVGKWNDWDVNFGVKFRHLNWSQIKEMAKEGFSFYSHTHTHPDLTCLEEFRLREELYRSKMELERELGSRVRYLSYPFGHYNERTKSVAREVGYIGCFASYPKLNSYKDPFAMRRHGMYIIDTLWDFRAKTMGRDGISFGFEDFKGRIINFFARGTYFVKRLQSTRRKVHSISEYQKPLRIS